MTEFSTTWNDASEADVSYTRISIPAVLSVMFGLASFLVFITPWFFFLSVIGILLALWSVVSIRNAEGILTGFGAAHFGLALSIVSVVSIGVLWPTYQYGVRREADKFFRIWFQAVAADDIPLAKGLASLYWERPDAKDKQKWWENQYENKFAHRDIHSYVDDKLVRTMLALGDKAKVSYYKTLNVRTEDDKDVVTIQYAVTFPSEKNGDETFFVQMTGQRRFPTGDVKSAGWSLSEKPKFVVPDEFK